MDDFFFRTEDIPPEEVGKYFVESSQDRRIVDALKNRNPTVLSGSRGVGKSFLLRVAQQELLSAFTKNRVFPVYLSFVRSSLLHSNESEQFKNWMLARVCSAIIRALMRAGLLAALPPSARILAGTHNVSESDKTKVELVAEAYENSWREPTSTVDKAGLPTVDDLKDALEDLCAELDIARFNLLIDEAAHIFLPQQQRQFFNAFS